MLHAGNFFVVIDVLGCYKTSLPFFLLSEEFDLTCSSVRRSDFCCAALGIWGGILAHVSHPHNCRT
jgi:hypothetical protein